MAAVLVLNTPDDGRLRPKHVEWLCRNKTCTVLHQVGVSFDLYYGARKHKIKIRIIVIISSSSSNSSVIGSSGIICFRHVQDAIFTQAQLCVLHSCGGISSTPEVRLYRSLQQLRVAFATRLH